MIDNARRLSPAPLCFLALMSLTASGCSWLPSFQSSSPPPEEPQRPALASSSAYLHLVSKAPPAPMQEIPPIIDDPQHETWRPGYWSYDNGQFNWIAGTVIDKPTLSAVWSPDHWEKREYGWAFVCGYWQ